MSWKNIWWMSTPFLPHSRCSAYSQTSKIILPTCISLSLSLSALFLSLTQSPSTLPHSSSLSKCTSTLALDCLPAALLQPQKVMAATISAIHHISPWLQGRACVCMSNIVCKWGYRSTAGRFMWSANPLVCDNVTVIGWNANLVAYKY